MLWRALKVKNLVSAQKIGVFSYGDHSCSSKIHEAHFNWINDKTEKKKRIQVRACKRWGYEHDL